MRGRPGSMLGWLLFLEVVINNFGFSKVTHRFSLRLTLLNIRPSTLISGSGGATGRYMGWRNGTVTNLEALDITCMANEETIKD